MAPFLKLDPMLFKWMGDLNSSREPHFWYTHLFLILGISVTYFYFPANSIANISLFLILGDAVAAFIGSKYGKTKILNTNKSAEGFLGFALTVWACQSLYFSNSLSSSFILLSSLGCGCVELFSGDSDNILLPLSYILLHRFYS